jgi:hypothetical protein
MASPIKRILAPSGFSKEEQARLLAEHKDAVKVEAALMRKAFDSADLRRVLTHAAQMLEELRTGSLTPKVRAAPL